MRLHNLATSLTYPLDPARRWVLAQNRLGHDVVVEDREERTWPCKMRPWVTHSSEGWSCNWGGSLRSDGGQADDERLRHGQFLLGGSLRVEEETDESLPDPFPVLLEAFEWGRAMPGVVDVLVRCCDHRRVVTLASALTYKLSSPLLGPVAARGIGMLCRTGALHPARAFAVITGTLDEGGLESRCRALAICGKRAASLLHDRAVDALHGAGHPSPVLEAAICLVRTGDRDAIADFSRRAREQLGRGNDWDDRCVLAALRALILVGDGDALEAVLAVGERLGAEAVRIAALADWPDAREVAFELLDTRPGDVYSTFLHLVDRTRSPRDVLARLAETTG